MLSTKKFIQWTLGVVMLAYAFGPTDRKTLGSHSDSPSEYYPPDFYPNGTDLVLPMGSIRYWLMGDPNGKKVVLIHGISTGAACYISLSKILADKGHYVLLFDLWGRLFYLHKKKGYAEAPPHYYDESLYTTQVALVLQKVGWTSTDVVGVSLGGAIATSFASFYPEMVNKLVLIAPAGLMHRADIPMSGKIVAHPLLMRLFEQGWIQPFARKAFKLFIDNSSLRKELADDPLVDQISSVATHQFIHHPGFIRAFLGTLADYPLSGLDERYRILGNYSNIPVFVLWGDNDKTVPYKYHHVLQKYVPHAQISHYKGGGHDILLSHRDRLNSEICDFLS
ncbi:Alpha/Beta hydrolase protein [Phycomyces blakesleeanus]|uniref:Alpha/Beta hydrolase protein n=1 Tax=Phycomyces blakesleeanus TaxID=4837 RepID=A0ABR3ATM5_PHYBL